MLDRATTSETGRGESLLPLENAVPRLQRLEDVYWYYLTCAQAAVGRFESPIVLKTDAHNERREDIPLPGGIAGNLAGYRELRLVELDRQIAAEARRLNPHLLIHEGDIRGLPFDDGSFHVVLDLSTLDHVRPGDVQVVLREYARVLRPGGELELFCRDRRQDRRLLHGPKEGRASISNRRF